MKLEGFLGVQNSNKKNWYISRLAGRMNGRKRWEENQFFISRSIILSDTYKKGKGARESNLLKD